LAQVRSHFGSSFFRLEKGGQAMRKRPPMRVRGGAAPGWRIVVVALVATLRSTSDSGLCALVLPRLQVQGSPGAFPRRLLLGTAGAALSAAQPLAGHASSVFGVDISFMDPPAPADVATPPADAKVLPSGLTYKMLLRPQCALSVSMSLDSGKCQEERPRAYDKVRIDYTGWTTNGKMFDSSRVEKRVVRVNSVMDGWTEGLQLMAPGEKRRFWVPAALAFGDTPIDETRPAGPLVFDIELYNVERQPKPPDELTGPPADAEVTTSGLAYKVLKPATGQRSPLPESNVTALYNGWSAKGDLVLSTAYGAQSTFLLKEIPIKGLLEGAQLMSEGETRRFWVPAPLAFGETPENPKLPGGPLVFDFRLETVQ